MLSEVASCGTLAAAPAGRPSTCTNCATEFLSYAKRGPVKKFCGVCAEAIVRSRGRKRPAGPVRRILCVDCGGFIEKERRSRRRTCAECRAKRDHIRVQKSRRAKVEREKEKKLGLRLLGKPWLQPHLTSAERAALRRKLDPRLRLARRAHRKRRRGNLSGALRQGAIRGKRVRGFLKWLGYSAMELRQHLERQFTEGMNWDEFAAGNIHIDHRIPLSAFDLDDPESEKYAWSLPNLQPMWAADNIAKRDKLIYLL